MLQFIPTMQPKLVDEAPAGDGWLHEIKYDGYRTQILVENGQARTFTRNGNDWTRDYSPIVAAAATLSCSSAIIDGEVCVQDERGVTDFGALRSAIGNAPHRLVFFAFDLMHLDGADLRRLPIEERRAKLADLIQGQSPDILILSEEVQGNGPQFFAAAEAAGLEGIVSKRIGSRYTSGYSDAWVKTKCWVTDTMDVIGVEKDREGVPVALLADGSGYRGSAYLRLPAGLRGAFWRFVESRESDHASIPLRSKKATFLQPGMKATVRYLRGSDKLRHAVIKDVVIEQ